MVTSSLRIRRADLRDAEAIARVHVESSEDAYRPLAKFWEWPGVPERTRMWQEWLPSEHRSDRIDLVAESAEGVVGFVTAGRPRRRDIDAESEVYVIHVLPAWRGGGVGGELWKKACDAVRSESLRSIYVATFAELRCCSFYEARGGVKSKSMPGAFMGGRVTEVVYSWGAGQPATARCP